MESEKIEKNKNNKNNNVNKSRLILAILFAIFLIFSHWLFINYFERMGRPVKENIPINLSQGKFSYYGIDSLSLYDERNYLYNLTGWAFLISSTDESTDLYKTEIVLFDERRNFVFDVDPQWREDIAKAYTDFLIRDTGFNVLINRNMIPLDRFCIGMLFTNTENSTQYFIITNRAVQNKLFRLDLLEDESYCESLLEKNIQP